MGVVGLGTATWGRGTDADDAAEQVSLLLDAGGDLVDVDAGGPALPLVASALADRAVRQRIFLAVRQDISSSQRTILGGLDQALVSAGVDHLDMWTVQGWDPDLPWDELVSAMTVAVSSGRARYVGVAPSQAWHASLIGGALGMHPQRLPLASLTFRYSLLDRADAEDLLDVSRTLEAGVLAAGPLAAGVLTGKYRHATPPDSRGAGERYGARVNHYRETWARPVVDGLCAAAEGLHMTPSALAVAWVLSRPSLTGCIVGARTVHQWRTALTSVGVTVPPEIQSALDEVSADADRMSHDGSSDPLGE